MRCGAPLKAMKKNSESVTNTTDKFEDKSMEKFDKKVWLATPTMHGDEMKYVQQAYDKTG